MFTTLRTASDEVNLHSRFLYALLDHVDPLSGGRENLRAFLHQVVDARGFNAERARVEREANHIDLLIRNDKQAVVVENKIWAGDQERQLQRYRDGLVDRGYACAEIRLVYLTPDGREPEAQSRGAIPPGRVTPVSYGSPNMAYWLIGCQRRAFDEPGLRESIAQYLHLIRRMTNTGDQGEHMSGLKELLEQGDNLVLAGQLSRALVHAEAAMVSRFYCELDKTLRAEIRGLRGVDPKWAHLIEETAIRECILGRRNSDSGLYYRIAEGAWLCVAGSNRLWLGVSCGMDEYPDLHGRLKEALAAVDAEQRAGSWAPWWRYVDEISGWGDPGEWLHLRDANEPSLKFLSGGREGQAKLAQAVGRTLAALFGRIKERGLAE